MKKTLIIAACLALLSCEKEQTNSYATISGKLENLSTNKLLLQNYNKTISDTLQITDNGTFRDTLFHVEKGFYNLLVADQRTAIYLEDGFHLEIKGDQNDFENSIAVTGKGAETSRYLQKMSRLNMEILGGQEGVIELFKKNEEEFKKSFEEFRHRLVHITDTTSNLSASVKARIKRDIAYQTLASRLNYPQYHTVFSDEKDYVPSDSFFSDLDTIPLNNEEDYIFSDSYRKLVSYNYRRKALGSLKDNNERSFTDAYLDQIITAENAYIREELLYSQLNSLKASKDITSFYEKVMAHLKDEKRREIFTRKYNEVISIAPGQPSPQFTNFENHAGGTTSLSDLKGKLVYIDVWATWCGPCIQELPSLDELQHEYRGKEITFVSISIDANRAHDKWKKMVNDKSMKGVQLWAQNAGRDSDFINKYMINTIPRFILIDKEGNIISPDAPRPSSEEIRTVLNKHLDI